MNEIASKTILAMALFQKSITWFCFIGVVYIQVYSELMSSMSKLAFLAVGTAALLGEVFA
jgi:hypothetical protein